MPSTRSRPLHPLAFVALLAFAPAVFAQEAARVEQQMTAEQFRAAGLHQLSPEQLANLNAWLNRTLDSETAKAAEAAKSEVVEQHRGFASFGSNEPIVARLSGEFRGFGKGRQYELDNGQVWQQEDSATLSGVRLSAPQVRITPGLLGNIWYLAVEGYNTRAKVRRVK